MLEPVSRRAGEQVSKARQRPDKMSMSDNRTAALWLQIDQLHLKFLQSEDTPAKLELRQKVEGESAKPIRLLTLL